MLRKNRSGRWKVSPTGHKKGGGIQGIRTASAAGAETLSDALGTRLHTKIPNAAKFCPSTLRNSKVTRGGHNGPHTVVF